MKAIIPLAAGKFGGESIVLDVGFEVRAERDRTLLVEFHILPSEV